MSITAVGYIYCAQDPSDIQLEEGRIREYCSENNFVLQEIINGKGMTDGRPGYLRLLQLIEDKAMRVVITTSSESLSRSSEKINLLVKMRENGITLITPIIRHYLN